LKIFFFIGSTKRKGGIEKRIKCKVKNKKGEK